MRVNCTSPEQECIFLQPDVEVDDNDEATSSKAQVAARKEFARVAIGWQQRETTSTEQSKQLLSVEADFAVLSFVCISRVFLLLSFLSCPKLSKAGTRGNGDFH